MATSLIMPIMDIRSLHNLKRDLEKQSLIPDELIIINAGRGISPDISSFKAKTCMIRDMPNARPGSARNRGFQLATGDILLFIDEGCRMGPYTLEALSCCVAVNNGIAWATEKPILASPLEEASYHVFSGNLSCILFERGLSNTFAFTRAMGISREAYNKLGGFPGWLRAGEDWLLGEKIAQLGMEANLCHGGKISWRPRASLLETGKQYWVYGRGDRRAGINKTVQLTKIAVYSGIISLYYQSLIALSASLWGLYTLFFTLISRWGLPRFKYQLTPFLVPVLFLCKDISSMAGYIMGISSPLERKNLKKRKKNYLCYHNKNMGI